MVAVAAAMVVLAVVGAEPGASRPVPTIVDEALKGVAGSGPRCRADAAHGRRGRARDGAGAFRPGGGHPAAPASLRPLTDDAPGALPVGYRAEDLIGAPVRDGAGAEIGRVRGLGLDDTSGVARAIVELAPLFGRPGKIAGGAVETLTPAPARPTAMSWSYRPSRSTQLPAYAWRDSAWRRAGAERHSATPQAYCTSPVIFPRRTAGRRADVVQSPSRSWRMCGRGGRPWPRSGRRHRACVSSGRAGRRGGQSPVDRQMMVRRSRRLVRGGAGATPAAMQAEAVVDRAAVAATVDAEPVAPGGSRGRSASDRRQRRAVGQHESPSGHRCSGA